MAEHPSLLVTIFAFLLVLGPLVLVHELGHYLVGRLFGVKADAFSIGFGKELAGWTDKRGTRWKLSALPLGGYVQFAGDMNPASAPDPKADRLTPEERAKTFHVKPIWQRALIVAAGPVTNLVVAIAIFAAFAMVTGREVIDPEVAGFIEKSDAQAAGLRIGDRIVAIDGNRIETSRDVQENVVYFPGRTISVAIKRGDQESVVPVKLSSLNFRDQFGNETKIADLGIDFVTPTIAGFAGESSARAAGLMENDRIISINDQTVTSFVQVAKIIQAKPGETVRIGIMRHGNSLRFSVPVSRVSVIDRGKRVTIGMIGVRPGKTLPVGFGESISLAGEKTVAVMRMMVTGIGQIFSGERSVRELGGPIKIAQFSGQQFSLGWPEFVWFAAMISINLAFINLLPIPGLDGGHLAFYAAEAVRRRPLGVRSQEWALRTGLAFVLALMLFVTINDIAGLPLFGG